MYMYTSASQNIPMAWASSLCFSCFYVADLVIYVVNVPEQALYPEHFFAMLEASLLH